MTRRQSPLSPKDAEKLVRGLLRLRGRQAWIAAGVVLAAVIYGVVRPAIQERWSISLPPLIPEPEARSTVPNKSADPDGTQGERQIRQAFRQRKSGMVVEARATVVKILPDDDIGDRHQKLIVRLSSGHSLLVAHNIDLASHVPASIGDEVRFLGEYEYSEQGGVIHWTHHDPAGRHENGWIELHGKRYE